MSRTMTRKQAAFEIIYDDVKHVVFREAGFYPTRREVESWIAVGCTTAQEIADEITRTPEENIF